MADITTLNSSDQVSDSRSTINTNFSNLNADKVETLSDLGVTASAAELNYVDGVTSNIQTQLGYTKRIYKSADETVNNSSTLQDDNELTFSIGANEVWAFTLCLLATSETTPNLRYKFTVPSGADYIMMPFYYSGSVGTNASSSYAFIGTDGDPFTNVDFAHGVVRNSSNAGSVQLQWSQDVAEASNSIVRRGSYIIAHKLA